MNVKQGDLAIITGAKVSNGKIVEVLSYLGKDPWYDGSSWLWDMGDCWLIKTSIPIITNRGNSYTILPCPDSWLRPVSGLPDNEFEEDKQLELTE